MLELLFLVDVDVQNVIVVDVIRDAAFDLARAAELVGEIVVELIILVDREP